MSESFTTFITYMDTSFANKIKKLLIIINNLIFLHRKPYLDYVQNKFTKNIKRT